ncbi:MAG: septum site-determining protein MinC [Lachnospiraceae bacterium]|nr:septum site-determining protein MinC [Lachnospiraceae bacterium]
MEVRDVKESVVIKSNAYGIVINMDSEVPFDTLLADISKKFKESAKFFKNAKMGISFKGRELTDEQERAILNVISENSNMEILCVVDNGSLEEQVFKNAVENKVAEIDAKDGQFYKGTLRSGQVFEAETSVVILGDVNPGATVISTGNIVVLGALKGVAYAGGNGNEGAFVVALEMSPVQIKIGDKIARCSDTTSIFKKRKKKVSIEPKIAFVEDGNIYIEPVSREVLNDLRLK